MRNALWILTGLVLLYVMASGPDGASIVVLTIVLLAVITVLHELGHFVAARAVGHTVFEVAIGVGPVILQRTSGPTHYVLRLLPVGGAVASASTDPSHYRLKRLVIIAGGPLVNAAMVAGGYLLRLDSAVGLQLVVLNVLVLAENLLPFRVRTGHGKQPTDGLALLRLLRRTSDADEAAAAAYAIGAERARASGDRDARRIAEEGLVRFPASKGLRSWIGTDLIASGEYEAARACYLALLAEDGLEEMPEAIYRNNLAWADLMIGDLELVPEALAQSGAAVAMLPKLDAIQGTRAFALIESGELREGLALARKVTARHADTKGKALNACTCAIGHAREWQLDEATRYLVMAERLDPACALLDRARAEVATRMPPGCPATPVL